MQYITINIFITAIIHCKNFKSHQEYLEYKYVVITGDKSWVYKEISKMIVDNHKIKQELKNQWFIQLIELLHFVVRAQDVRISYYYENTKTTSTLNRSIIPYYPNIINRHWSTFETTSKYFLKLTYKHQL
jgi:hypothetical protein